MSEIKQGVLKYELAQIGFPDAKYFSEIRKPDGITEPDKIRINPNDIRMPEINNAGDIRYGREYDSLAVSTIKPLVDKVNEIVAVWEHSRAIPFENLSQFRVLAEYNNIILAARNDIENGRGLYFTTWQYNFDRTGLDHGHYTEDYVAAKEDFAIRAGLIPATKILAKNQAAEIITVIENLFENDYDLYLTSDKVMLLSEIIENLRCAYPMQGEN